MQDDARATASPAELDRSAAERPRQLAIIIGAGGVTSALLRELGEGWRSTVIDPDEAALSRVQRHHPVTCVCGDGSSPVVLLRAGLQHAEALVAASGDDDVNIAACREALASGVPRVVAAVADVERTPEYVALGIDFVARDRLAAVQLVHSLEPRRVVHTEFAGGRAAGIEIHLAGDSPAVGRALHELPQRTWVVGAVLRGDTLIIPHGDTVLEAGDIVAVMGAAGDFSEIVRTFTGGEARFPLAYGSSVAVPVSGPEVSTTFMEAAYFTRISRAQTLIAMLGGGGEEPDAGVAELLDGESGGVPLELRSAAEGETASLRALLGRESVGVIALPAPERGFLGRFTASSRIGLARRYHVALLFSRARRNYARIVIPARLSRSGRLAARAGIDLARAAGAQVTAVAVEEPGFAARLRHGGNAAAAIAWVREEAYVQRLHVQTEIRQGNPVREILAASEDADLVVLGSGGGLPLLHVPVANHVARRTDASVLIVPALG